AVTVIKFYKCHNLYPPEFLYCSFINFVGINSTVVPIAKNHQFTTLCPIDLIASRHNGTK
ncbi:MAG TPA: hypothetical protein VL442_01630, partial [Mucilaginibacter sp.]|nr:hypothetical protein [Mucilaginibacter sp.]